MSLATSRNSAGLPEIFLGSAVREIRSAVARPGSSVPTAQSFQLFVFAVDPQGDDPARDLDTGRSSLVLHHQGQTGALSDD